MRLKLRVYHQGTNDRKKKGKNLNDQRNFNEQINKNTRSIEPLCSPQKKSEGGLAVLRISFQGLGRIVRIDGCRILLSTFISTFPPSPFRLPIQLQTLQPVSLKDQVHCSDQPYVQLSAMSSSIPPLNSFDDLSSGSA